MLRVLRNEHKILNQELQRAQHEHEMRMEHLINMIRAGLIVLALGADASLIVATRGMGAIRPHISAGAVTGLGIAVAYLVVIHVVTRPGQPYRHVVRYITISLDYLGVLVMNLWYQQTDLFAAFSGNEVALMFVAMYMIIHLLSGLRFSWQANVYSAVVATGLGVAMVLRQAETPVIALIVPPLMLGAGFLTAYIAVSSTRLYRQVHQREKLLRFLSPAVVENIDAGRITMELGGEQRDVTVLISDIRGFTKMAERMEPRRLVTMLNEYFTAMTHVIFRYGGTIDKFLGDGILALFGTPVSKPDDAVRAVQAACDMHQALGELNVRWAAQGAPEWQMGIALHSGTVIAGNIGAPERMEYTVIGDTVNLTSRVEALNKEYKTGILLTASTKRRLHDAIPTQALGEA